MKYLKMLGLAAVAAMALMAFLGASSASATVLCTTGGETTGCTMPYGVGTVIDASLKAGTSAKLWNDPKGSNPLVTCTGSTVKGSINNAGSSTQTAGGGITELAWSGCSATTDTINVGQLEIHWIPGTDNGTVTGSGSNVTVNLGTSCTYGTGTGTHLGVLTGGEEPIIKIETTINKSAGGFLCPEHAIWEAEYVVTEPHALYVSEK